MSLLLCGIMCANAQTFEDYFEDRTLRLDYNFAGNIREQTISLKHLHFSELPVEGNGQITVRDHKTGNVIYRNSFSTLFQEWLSYPEAQKTRRSFENVFLIPMPKDTIDITLDLRNNRREIMTSFSHQVDPTDNLIRHTGK